jgi:anti-sigma factor RsiW
MTNCSEWRDRIEAYADGELAPPDMMAFRAHTEGCAACAAAALAAAESKAAIRRAGDRYAAASALRARISRLAEQADGKAKAEVAQVSRETRQLGFVPKAAAAWPRWALAAAALMVLAAGLFMVANRRQESGALAEFVDLHVADLASANPVEVISTDRHTVKPWFQGKIPFTFDVPELQGTPFSLVGGRVAYFHQEPGAHLVFRYQRHFISVFIFRQTSQVPLPTSSYADQTSSFRLQTWTQGGLRYVVVGDAGMATIQQLADLLRSPQ